MFIKPQTVIDNKWIKFPTWMDEDFKKKCVQPNGIDITADKIYIPTDPITSFTLTEQNKKMRDMRELRVSIGQEHWEIFQPYIDIMSDFYVTIPAGVAAYLIVRSTLNRNGLFVTSGLYDQGFSNYVGMVLHNHTGYINYLAPHTRVAQLCFVKSDDSGKMYDGVYNSNVGEHWSA